MLCMLSIHLTLFHWTSFYGVVYAKQFRSNKQRQRNQGKHSAVIISMAMACRPVQPAVFAKNQKKKKRYKNIEC